MVKYRDFSLWWLCCLSRNGVFRGGVTNKKGKGRSKNQKQIPFGGMTTMEQDFGCEENLGLADYGERVWDVIGTGEIATD